MSLARARVRQAEEAALDTDSVLSRAELAGFGIDRWDVGRELAHGRWASLGRHTIAIHRGPLTEQAQWRHALHEVGSHGALDGPSSLAAAGLRGYAAAVHVSVLHGCQPVRIPGVVVKELRGWRAEDVVGAGLRRVASPLAAVRGASWASTDRQAALLLVMTAQQRVALPTDMFEMTSRFKRLRRCALIKGVLADILDGVQALGELDFARECRRRGLPKPSRQVIRQGRHGRVYLDVYFDDFGVIVEIEGAHHDGVLNAVDDALRQNALVEGGDDFLRIPVIGFRTQRDAFMAQLETKLANKGWRRQDPSCG